MNRGLLIALWWLSLVALAVSVALAVWCDSLDAAILDRADAAGWDTSLLLPQQNLVWLAMNGQVVVVAALAVLATVALLRNRRSA